MAHIRLGQSFKIADSYTVNPISRSPTLSLSVSLSRSCSHHEIAGNAAAAAIDAAARPSAAAEQRLRCAHLGHDNDHDGGAIVASSLLQDAYRSVSHTIY